MWLLMISSLVLAVSATVYDEMELESNGIEEPETPMGGCPVDYILDNSRTKCYKLFLNPKTWPEALTTCQLENAHLVTEGETKVMSFLAEQLRAHDVIPSEVPFYRQYAFIGAKKQTPGDWRDISGQPFKFGASWVPGQPSNLDGKEDCLTVDRFGYFNDYFCDRPAVFFCVKDLKTNDYPNKDSSLYSLFK